MLFPTIDFALFFFVVYVGAWLLNDRVVAWKLWMLAASYYFYAYWDWHFCFLLLASTVIAHVGATGISTAASPRAKRAWLVASLVGLLGLLGYFKYYGFFAVNVSNVLSHVGLGHLIPLLTPTLPIAISFFTFMAVSYVVDVYRGTLERRDADRRRRPTSRSSRTSSPDRSSAAASCSRSCDDRATPTTSTCRAPRCSSWAGCSRRSSSARTSRPTS